MLRILSYFVDPRIHLKVRIITIIETDINKTALDVLITNLNVKQHTDYFYDLEDSVSNSTLDNPKDWAEVGDIHIPENNIQVQ